MQRFILGDKGELRENSFGVPRGRAVGIIFSEGRQEEDAFFIEN